MRKALIGLILAATAMTPVAAEAQGRGERGNRAERVRALEDRGTPRAERQQQRVERQQVREQRQEVRQQRQEARQQRQSQPVAVTQQRDRRGDRGDRPARSERNSSYPSAWQGNPNDPRREHYERLERRNQYRHGTAEQRRDVRREVRQERREDRRDWRQDRRDDRRDWRQDRREDRRDWRQDRRESRRDWRRDWNRDWRHDRRYDWGSWRSRNRHYYRLPAYYAPYRDWSYRRFSIGFFLEPLFYSQRYWIGDPWQYRLPPAPPGTQWVRYYNDVLLVDTWSGEVIDVIYDFFW